MAVRIGTYNPQGLDLLCAAVVHRALRDALAPYSPEVWKRDAREWWHCAGREWWLELAPDTDEPVIPEPEPQYEQEAML